MKNFLQKSLATAALISILLSSNLASADALGVFSLDSRSGNSGLIRLVDVDERARRPYGESYQGITRRDRDRGRYQSRRNFNEQQRGFRAAINDNIGAHRNRREYNSFSYTSQPLRGGSSRRTRIIENPYAGRFVTGSTLTGINTNQVHIKDVVAYPGRFLLSPLAYSLSQYDRPRFINTQTYIDCISVAAKWKEFFTVTFHYD